MNTRKNVRCNSCGSLERTRLVWLYIEDLNLPKDARVLHIAPERGIYEVFSKRQESGFYECADISPSGYPFAKNHIRKIDLCHLENEPSNHYDLILHSHVLEHIPCNLAYPLFHLHRMLTQDGHHIFIIPIGAGKYEESFQNMPAGERARRFGQDDHVRRFGKSDLNQHLGSLVNLPKDFDATTSFSESELSHANIPEHLWRGYTGASVIQLRKKDMTLLTEVSETPLQMKLEETAEELSAVLATKSWKITSPLRELNRRVKRLAKVSRSEVK